MATLLIPNKLINDTKAYASKVDANFDAIKAIVNGKLDDINIANAGITASLKLKPYTIINSLLADNIIDNRVMATDAIRADEIAPGVIGAGHLDSIQSKTMSIANLVNKSEASKLHYHNLIIAEEVTDIGVGTTLEGMVHIDRPPELNVTPTHLYFISCYFYGGDNYLPLFCARISYSFDEKSWTFLTDLGYTSHETHEINRRNTVSINRILKSSEPKIWVKVQIIQKHDVTIHQGVLSVISFY